MTKIDLNKINRIKSKRDQNILVSKETELIEYNTASSSDKSIYSDNLTVLLNTAKRSDKFIPSGKRQQISINSSDYTNSLIELLIESKKELEGEKIRKTSYLEKILKDGLEREIKKMNIYL